MTYNFDLDGTLVDLYGVDNWITEIRNGSTKPYEMAKPLVNFSLLARYINKAQANGHTFNVISWGAMNATDEFNARIEKAKVDYLAKHLPSVHWDNIFVVAYGTPKETLADGVLFDDEEANRNHWGVGAYEPKEIMEILKNL